jgi:hypothetical protein
VTSKILFTLIITLTLIPAISAGQSKPVNIALFNPIQIFPEDNSITGVRLNLLYGKNAAVSGLDLGFVNHVGTGGFTGLEWGAVNICDGKLSGLQGGFLNLANQDVEGFQYGWFNKGEHVSGVQLGLVNMAESMKGLQVGLINMIKHGGQFPVFPIVNWSF